MSLTRKELIFYTEKMNVLNINQNKVYTIFKEKKVTYTQVFQNIDYKYNAVSSAINGINFNPKILIDIYQYLSAIKTPVTLECCTNLKREEKNLGYLLDNGFSYSEAIRIAI